MNVAQLLERSALYYGERIALVAGDRHYELRALCRAVVAEYKVPDRIEFVRALPKNPTGKILKKDLRAWG